MTDLLEYNNESILWITGAEERSASEIISLVSGLGAAPMAPQQTGQYVPQEEPQGIQSQPQYDSGIKYIHATQQGRLAISEGEGIMEHTFDGKFDCKLIDTKMEMDIKSSAKMRLAIQKGLLEIIDSSVADILIKKYDATSGESNKGSIAYDRDSDTMIHGQTNGAAPAINLQGAQNNGVLDLTPPENGGTVDVGGRVFDLTPMEL